MDLDKFEFSETYLFFWDKFERSNTYLQWFIDNPQYNPGDREFEYMTSEGKIVDGAYMNYWIELVEKYGMIPKEAMQETYQSSDSDDMNQTINLYLNSAVVHMRKQSWNNKKSMAYKQETLETIYSILVKYLGSPPTKFDWVFYKGEEVERVCNFTPMMFKEMVTPGMSMQDFVVLTDLPNLPRGKVYTCKQIKNVQEGRSLTFLNLSMEDLSDYTKKSIVGGMSVWFAADVSQSFNFYHSTLDDKITNTDSVFGPYKKMTKSEALTIGDISPCHAMTFTGVNVEENGTVASWQVENSWGYCDNLEEGLDGFLYMSNDWMKRFVFQVAIFKNLLSKQHLKMLEQIPIELKPWEISAAALEIKGVNAPINYLQNLKRK